MVPKTCIVTMHVQYVWRRVITGMYSPNGPMWGWKFPRRENRIGNSGTRRDGRNRMGEKGVEEEEEWRWGG